MNKKELIEKIKKLPFVLLSERYISQNYVLELLKQLDEPEKVTIPQFVADWYEENKNNFEKNIYDCIVGWGIHSNEIREWIRENKSFQTLVNMHQFGYEVEKEKRYLVKAKGVYLNSCLVFDKGNKKWFFSSIYEKEHQIGYHTRKELENAGFGEVFNSPLFEVKEVE